MARDPAKQLLEVINRMRDELRILSYRALLIRGDLAKQSQEIAQASKSVKDSARNRQITAVLSTPRPIQEEEREARAAQGRYQRRNLIATWAGVGVVLAYTTFAALQWCSMRKANDLFAKQLELSQRAIVETPNPIQWNPNTREVSFEIRNTGPSTATLLNFTAQARRESLPGFTPIGVPISLPVTTPQEMKQNGGATVTWPFPWFPPSGTFDEANPWPGKEVLIVEGQFSYNDGFRDKAQPFCYFYLPNWSVPSLTGWNLGGFSRTGQCDISGAIQSGLEFKKSGEQELKTHHKQQ